ncbi:PREDICTED: uncharacterized protein LOC106817976 [Priapulus caudatus]|uniref:Uncharacterized protein LOC106817976 n=1 Tax=Priapulus caudatus TaxID=37621 RepID=A0ABM1F145_PRICU|nr:PREDICTED: uncharacterized protein LOC106817976 [Priapulus caudatus]
MTANIGTMDTAITTIENAMLSISNELTTMETYVQVSAVTDVTEAAESFGNGLVNASIDFAGYLEHKLLTEVGYCGVFYEIYNVFVRFLCAKISQPVLVMWVGMASVCIFGLLCAILSFRITKYFKRPIDYKDYVDTAIGGGGKNRVHQMEAPRPVIITTLDKIPTDKPQAVHVTVVDPSSKHPKIYPKIPNTV